VTPDARIVAGLLLVIAPLLGAIPIAYPPFLTVWSAPRERHVATVAAHRRAWHLLNAGFVLATVGTGAGLVALVIALDLPAGWSAPVAALTAAYLTAGMPWLAVLGIRARTTPALEDIGATAGPPGQAEVLLAAATGGLFATFVLATGLVLVALCAVLALAGAVAVPVALLAALIAGVATGSQLLTGDTVPAVLYPPTMLLGVAILAGWT
jgi:hypothetical protein